MSNALLSAVFLEAIRRQDPAGHVRSFLAAGDDFGPEVTLLALGKSAVLMAEAATEMLGPRIRDTVVVAPNIPAGKAAGWIRGSHPTPTIMSEVAGRALLRAAAQARGQVLTLVSGGGSALAAVPAEGVSLAAKVQLIDSVYAAGAPIRELNTLRKELSAIKGGRLAQASSVPVHSLYLSDVALDILDVIASGPTLPASSTACAALAVVQRYLGNSANGRAIDFLRAAHPLKTSLPGRIGDTHHLLAGVDALADSALAIITEGGLCGHRLARFTGPVDRVATELLQKISAPGVWVAGGEATIVLPAHPGRGGRAQQLALTLALQISGRDGVEILVGGSDGVDGNSAAAGAIVNGQSVEKLRRAGWDPAHALQECNAAPALAAIGAQINIGPTQVNHADLVLMHVV